MKTRSTRLHAPKSRPRPRAARSPGAGRREVVRGSGIYPASGPLPPGRAKVIPAGALGHTKSTPASRGSRAALARTLPKRAATHRAVAARPIRYPHDVPRAEWEDFLNDFSTEHDGWESEIKVSLPNQSARFESRGLPLEGVSIDYKAKECITAVSAGTERADHIQRLVPRTTRITEINKDSLEIAAADRTRTLLRCRKPSR